MARTALLRIVLPLALALSACSTYAAYSPRERVDSESPGGRPAASYLLNDEAGKTVGELRVWSDGGQRNDDGHTVIHVGFELENQSDTPLALDVASTRLVGLGSVPDTAIPGMLTGDAVAAPGSVGRCGIDFVLPAGAPAPLDLESFSASWRVVEPGGEGVYRQITPFGREQRRYAYYGWYGYPGWYGPYGCWW